MARGDQALRQWKILATILSHSRYGITQEDLLREIQDDLEPRGKGKRTLQRDFNALAQSGFPIDNSGRDGDGKVLYKPAPTFQRLPPIMPNVQELTAFAVARSLLTMYEGTPFKEHIDSLWLKVQPVFAQEARESLEEAMGMFGVLDRPATDFTPYKSSVNQLTEAIELHKQLSMVYYSRRQRKNATYLIDPIMLFTHARLLYLAAYTYRYKEVRHFSLGRIKTLSPTGRFFPRRTYSLEDLKSKAFGMIMEDPFELTVRLDKAIADEVRLKIHHPTQRVKTLPNGDVVVTIMAGGWDEMKAWVLGYSYRAEVLKPDAMREEIRQDIEHMLTNYLKGGSHV